MFNNFRFRKPGAFSLVPGSSIFVSKTLPFFTSGQDPDHGSVMQLQGDIRKEAMEEKNSSSLAKSIGLLFTVIYNLFNL